jgi:hypothetical protein
MNYSTVQVSEYTGLSVRKLQRLNASGVFLADVSNKRSIRYGADQIIELRLTEVLPCKMIIALCHHSCQTDGASAAVLDDLGEEPDIVRSITNDWTEVKGLIEDGLVVDVALVHKKTDVNSVRLDQFEDILAGMGIGLCRVSV